MPQLASTIGKLRVLLYYVPLFALLSQQLISSTCVVCKNNISIRLQNRMLRIVVLNVRKPTYDHFRCGLDGICGVIGRLR